MKNPFQRPLKGAFTHAAQCLCFALGTAYPLLLALDMPVQFALCAACCAAAAGLYFLLCCVKRVQWLIYPLLMLGMFAPFVPYLKHPLGNALALLLSGQPLALAVYARPVTILISLLATALGLSLAQSEASFFPTALIACGVLFAVSFSGVSAVTLLPLVAALLLSARGQGVSFLRLAPSAALVFLLTALCLPHAGSTVPLLRDTAETIRQAIDDYLFFNDARTAFSLSTTGYQPLGSERLGGPVAPADTPVMTVTTSGKTLLRGVIKNEYTSLAWRDSTTQRRYLFVNPRFSALKDDLFDLSRPAGGPSQQLPAKETITVSMRADATSTLYLTQRFSAPKGEGIVAYFSPSSEVFATHSLATGESYTFSGVRLTSETEGVRSLVLEAMDARDPYLSDVNALYLQLPDALSPQVYVLAQEICARIDNDYDRAAAICLYLQNTYPYTLLQNEPPTTRDFVSWFLFEEQKGYCTSFASAMAVMCRTLGIPARYIEGYAAMPEADGIARVTQQHAHAWVEVYFPGFGWLPFDPTPGIGDAPDHSGNTPPENQNPQENPDAPTPSPDGTPEGSDASPSPSPTPTPTPTPHPSPTPNPTVLPTPTPEHDDPSVTPTPQLTPTPSPIPQDTPSPVPSPTPPSDLDDPNPPDLLKWLLIAALMLLILALAVWRLYNAAPTIAAARVRMTNDALLIWYAAITETLRAMGLSPADGEAPATFLNRAQEQLGEQSELLSLGKSVCAARYSRHKLSKKQVEHAQAVYAALLERLSFAQAIRMYARRLLLGTRIYR